MATPRPVGRSFLSDLATTGAGFAAGLKKERDERKEEQIAKSIRDFQQKMQMEQLGLEKQQMSLAEEQNDRAFRAEAAQRADREFSRVQTQLEFNRREAADRAEAARFDADRELKRAQMKQEAELARMQMLNNLKIARLNDAGDNSRVYISQLASLEDDYRATTAELLKDPDVFAAQFDKRNTLTRLTTQLSGLKPGSPEHNKILDKLDKVNKFNALQEERTQNRVERKNAIRQAQGITQQLGGAYTGPPADDKIWEEYSPEEKMAAKQRLANIVANKQKIGEPPEWTKWLEEGLTTDDLEEVNLMANQLLQTETPTPASPQSRIAPASPVPPKAGPTPTPNIRTVPPGVQALQRSAPPPPPPQRNPIEGLLQRAPVMSGPGITPNPVRQFLTDSINRHRIPR